MAIPAVLRGLFGLLVVAYITAVATIGVSVVFLLYLVMRPIAEGPFLRLGCWIQSSFLAHFALFIYCFFGIQLDVRGVMPPAEGALVLANHLTHDWVLIYSLAYQIGTLGFVRTVIKKVISYIPGMGWGMWALYWPFVSRDYNKDELVLKKLFGAYERHNLPVQTWLFPEGTRRTPKKLAQSQAYCKENGYPVWEHVMLPRHRGFILAINSLKGAVRMIHEATVVYEGWSSETPSLWDFLTTDQSQPHTIHVHFTRTPISALPADDAGKKQWLLDSFARKNELICGFKKDGNFPGPKQNGEVAVGPMIPHVIAWLVCCLGLLKVFGAL